MASRHGIMYVHRAASENRNFRCCKFASLPGSSLLRKNAMLLILVFLYFAQGSIFHIEVLPTPYIEAINHRRRGGKKTQDTRHTQAEKKELNLKGRRRTTTNTTTDGCDAFDLEKHFRNIENRKPATRLALHVY